MPPATTDASKKVTPPQLAKRWGVSPLKVIEFIEHGELRAINLARANCKRPRYAIDEADITAFEMNRLVVPSAPAAPRIRRTSSRQTARNYFG